MATISQHFHVSLVFSIRPTCRVLTVRPLYASCAPGNDDFELFVFLLAVAVGDRRVFPLRHVVAPRQQNTNIFLSLSIKYAKKLWKRAG